MHTTHWLTTHPLASVGLRFARAGIVASLILTAAGCRLLGGMPGMKEADGAKVEDPWTTQAGMEGRAGRSVEKESDPLNLRRFLLSEKAMEIERNCGYE